MIYMLWWRTRRLLLGTSGLAGGLPPCGRGPRARWSFPEPTGGGTVVPRRLSLLVGPAPSAEPPASSESAVPNGQENCLSTMSSGEIGGLTHGGNHVDSVISDIVRLLNFGIHLDGGDEGSGKLEAFVTGVLVMRFMISTAT